MPAIDARIIELESEVERLHEFILRVADHLYLAAEVLSILAERISGRVSTSWVNRSDQVWDSKNKSIIVSAVLRSGLMNMMNEREKATRARM